MNLDFFDRKFKFYLFFNFHKFSRDSIDGFVHTMHLHFDPTLFFTLNNRKKRVFKRNSAVLTSTSFGNNE